MLSIIIVNYNVKHFLEHCLFSVKRAIENIDAEVWIVDNNSTDDSVAFLRAGFPDFHFLESSQNLGFSKACNIGLENSLSKYVLFLNPDVLVAEDSLEKCIQFLKETPTAGALGVRMIDGNGGFLKESKRAFPTPITSLFKLFGVSRLFPKSSFFAKYYLGHLPEAENQKIDVVSGAFFMAQKSILEKVGGFDPQFFMYGEDIDLSYRIKQAGYENYFFAETTIIHFKGESTKKGNLNYIKMFYQAMRLFVKKHYHGSASAIYVLFIQIAIQVRAGFSIFGNFMRRAGIPILDALVSLFSFWFIKWMWNYFHPQIIYDAGVVWKILFGFTILLLIVSYYFGLYDKWHKASRLINAAFVSVFVLLAVYSLLPENYRFSRAIVVLGSAASFLLMGLLRKIYLSYKIIQPESSEKQSANILIVGTKSEYEGANKILMGNKSSHKLLGRLAVEPNDESAIDNWRNIEELRKKVYFQELIFCIGTNLYKTVIDYLPQKPKKTGVSFYASGSHSIISSYNKNESGNWQSDEAKFEIQKPFHKRLKRLLDVVFAVFGIFLFPILALLVNKPVAYLSNCFLVLMNTKTWVGYILGDAGLPPLKNSVIACNGMPHSYNSILAKQELAAISYNYAKSYNIIFDLKMLLQRIKYIGG